MLLSMICFRHAAEPLSATISEIFTAFWNSPSVTPVSTVTGRVLPQDGGLETLSGGLGRGWGPIDIKARSRGRGGAQLTP